MPKQMVTPHIEEISGVDFPAHLVSGWAMMKDASPETAAILARAELVAKGIDPATLTEGSTMPEPKFNKEALSADVVEYIDGLEAELAKAKKTPAPVVAPANDDDDDDDMEKALVSLPEPVRKAILREQREGAANRAMVKSLLDERETAQYEKMAKSLDALPGTKTDVLAETMRKASHGDTEAINALFKTLSDTAAYLRENDNLTKSIGSSSDGTAGPSDELNAKAEQIRKADPTMSPEMAMTKAVRENPALYKRHLRED